ncbi:MAG: discoidin domain-containing protein, partial [Verrucomicrobiota bacterium]
TISLDGTWQLTEGQADQMPAQFDRKVPVPGLVDLAQPAFAPDAFKATKRLFGPGDAALAQRSYWYRREFVIKGDVPAVATLLVRKAAYGSTVYLNGTKVGESLASFTANCYDVRGALRGGGATNELVIRVGASRASLPPSVPTGFDYEKKSFIPGLFDSVELALSGTPNLVQVQVAPEISTKEARVVALVHNAGSPTDATLKFVVREAKSGKVVGRIESELLSLAASADQTVEVRIPIADCRLWWPEKPFLYTLDVSSGADSFEARFGMREFRFEPRQGDTPGRAYLNGKPYFLRGSNVALYRFFEDTERAALPWQEDWVRLLHRRFKEMHWNALRYSIGFAPELWYRIADEEGILIEDEFPIWEGGQRINWPAELKRDELAREYTAWMQERWNHACVVIWDAQNESLTTETGAALMQVRGLDLSNRPWDNGWSPLMSPTDECEAHPYHWGNPRTTLAKAIADPVGMPWTDGDCSNPNNRNAYVINEYGWLWLTRDGRPTSVTRNLYANLAGRDAPPSKLFPLAARLLAAETEYWRCRRQAAGVLEFCGLGYSRPDEPTSDHWLDVKRLIWEPEYFHYVRDAFAPVGLMVDFTKERILAGSKPTQVPVVVINDLEKAWHGPVILRLKRGGHVETEMKQECRLEPWGKSTLNFEVKWPTQTGPCTLEAELAGVDGKPVRSLRDTQLVDDSSFGLAFHKTATASSVQEAAYAPANAVDGDASTYWSSAFTDPAWLAVDLGAVHKVSLVRILWEAAYSKAFSVQVSTDGQAWTEVYHTAQGKGGTSEIKFAPVEARHVRVLGTERGTQWGHAIQELEVFE